MMQLLLSLLLGGVTMWSTAVLVVAAWLGALVVAPGDPMLMSGACVCAAQQAPTGPAAALLGCGGWENLLELCQRLKGGVIVDALRTWHERHTGGDTSHAAPHGRVAAV